MLHELKEFRDLVDRADSHRPGRGIPEPPTEEELTRCIQVLLSRQCLYPHQQSLTRSYAIMACPEYQGFFQKYFAAMGLEFHFDTRSRMVALRFPGTDKRRYDWQAARLKKDETLVLYVLKLAYEEGFRTNTMGTRGEVEITTDDLMDKLDVVAGVEIEESRLTEILGMLRRKGIVELGERDPVERVRPLTVLPGIEVAVPDPYVEQVREWAERQPKAETGIGAGPQEPQAEFEGDENAEAEEGA